MVRKRKGFGRIEDDDPLLLQFFVPKKGGYMQLTMSENAACRIIHHSLARRPTARYSDARRPLVGARKNNWRPDRVRQTLRRRWCMIRGISRSADRKQQPGRPAENRTRRRGADGD